MNFNFISEGLMALPRASTEVGVWANFTFLLMSTFLLFMFVAMCVFLIRFCIDKIRDRWEVRMSLKKPAILH